MKFVIQRVKNAKVEVDSEIIGKIGKGYLVLIGITEDDTKKTADLMIKKMLSLRVFSDECGKMNLSLTDVNGEILLVSQFTLYANCKKGNRPDFMQAMKPEKAKELYEYIVEECKKTNYKIENGIFGADMSVHLINDGPVTIIIDSKELGY